MPIRKTRQGWKIDNVPGHHETREEAEEQLRAIKASEHDGRREKREKSNGR